MAKRKGVVSVRRTEYNSVQSTERRNKKGKKRREERERENRTSKTPGLERVCLGWHWVLMGLSVCWVFVPASWSLWWMTERWVFPPQALDGSSLIVAP